MPFGNAGVPTQLTTNTFALNFLPERVFRHVVEFEPEIPPERIRQRRITLGQFKQEVFRVYGQNWFDGTCLLTLAAGQNCAFGPSASGSSIRIRFIREIDTKDQDIQEVNMIVNVMTKKLLRRQRMILIGRSYFYPEPKSLQVQYHSSVPQAQQVRMKIYSGFNVSVQPCVLGNLMTVDLVSRVMQELSVRTILSNLMEEAKRDGKSREDFQTKAKAILVGSTVMCSYNQKPWRVDDIDFTKTMNSTFTIEADTRPPRAPREGQPARAPFTRGNPGIGRAHV